MLIIRSLWRTTTQFIDDQKARLYVVEAVQITTPASSRGESVSDSRETDRSPHPPAGVTERFAHMVNAVKRGMERATPRLLIQDERKGSPMCQPLGSTAAHTAFIRSRIYFPSCA